MTIKLTLTLLAMTSLGCSNGSQFGENRSLKSGEKVSSENYDDQSNFAEVPSAVAGGLYLLECNHQIQRLDQVDCTLNNENEKTVLGSVFSKTELKVETPAGLEVDNVSVNLSTADSHWTVNLRFENEYEQVESHF